MSRRHPRGGPAGILVVLGALVWGSNVPAQEPPPAAATEEFAERVEVEVVNVDVVVTDKSKRRILDLGRDDFELLIDGRPVAIEYFAGPRFAGATAPTPPAPPAGAAASTLATAPGPSAGPPATPSNLIFYIDQTALESHDRKTALEELREFLRSRPGGADRVTVAVFEQSLRLLQTPTTDPKLVAQALDQVEIRPTLAVLGSRERIQLEHEVRDFGTFGGDPRALEQAIVSWGEQRIDLQRRSIAALGQMIDSLAAVEGRKVILLATVGVESNPAQFLLAALDQQRGRLTASGSDRGPVLELAGQTLLEEFEAMIRSAQNARVTLYGISPVVRPPVQGGAEFRSTGPGAARPLPHDFGPAEAAASIARLTGATGGASLTIWGDLDRRLEGVTADIDAAYSLGFSTGSEAGDEDHRIEVRIRRADLTVRHRESFRRSSAPGRAAAALTAAATLGQSENPLEITLSLGEGRPDGKKKSGEIVPFAVGIPIRLLGLVPSGNERRGSISVRVSIHDARGRLLESGVTVVPIVVPEGDIERALAAIWYHRAEVHLAAGRQRVAVAVVDEVSGLQSTTFEEVEIPAAN
jgi:VWFA-related protein